MDLNIEPKVNEVEEVNEVGLKDSDNPDKRIYESWIRNRNYLSEFVLANIDKLTDKQVRDIDLFMLSSEAQVKLINKKLWVLTEEQIQHIDINILNEKNNKYILNELVESRSRDLVDPQIKRINLDNLKDDSKIKLIKSTIEKEKVELSSEQVQKIDIESLSEKKIDLNKFIIKYAYKLSATQVKNISVHELDNGAQVALLKYQYHVLTEEQIPKISTAVLNNLDENELRAFVDVNACFLSDKQIEWLRTQGEKLDEMKELLDKNRESLMEMRNESIKSVTDDNRNEYIKENAELLSDLQIESIDVSQLDESQQTNLVWHQGRCLKYEKIQKINKEAFENANDLCKPLFSKFIRFDSFINF